MAYSFVSASSQSISAASAVLTSYPLTISALTRVTSAASTYRHIGIVDASAANRLATFTLASGEVRAFAVDASNAQGSVRGTYSDNVWFHAGGVWAATTSRVGYLDGAAGASSTLSISPSGADRLAIGGFLSFFLDGRSADVAIWNVVLTAEELVSLAKGFRPSRVRPQSLRFYAPLIRNLQDIRNGLALTNNNGASVSDHPRVY